MIRTLQSIRPVHRNIHGVLACPRVLACGIERGAWRPASAADDGPAFGKTRDKHFGKPFRQIIDIPPTPMGFGDRKDPAD